MAIPRTTASFLAALACTPLLFLVGCLERVETITVNPDGSALLSGEFRGTPDDFKKTADALPENGSEWAVTERTDKDVDGKPRIVRVATLQVPAGVGLPSSYAAPGDARAATTLQFPTTLKTSRSGPNTYYDFARTYPRRDEARFRYHEKTLTETDEFKKIKDADPAALTVEQRTTLVRTLVKVEAFKKVDTIEAAAAALEADGSWPQEIGLTLRRAALDYAERFNIARAMEMLAQGPSEARDAAIGAETAVFTDGLHRAVGDTLAKLNVTEDQRLRFIDAAKKAMTMRAATEDLSDERWEVRVRLPGTIAASNADRVENGLLIWEFSAQAFFDRDHSLRATSWIGPTGYKSGQKPARE
jgi:hypothetical protein